MIKNKEKNQKTCKRLGVIGGVSTYAFSRFYLSITEKYRNRFLMIPELVVYSPNLSGELEEAFVTGTLSKEKQLEMEFLIREWCTFLKKSECDAVAICCNTLSKLFYKIASEYNFNKIFTPVNSTLSQIERDDYVNPLILGSRYTVKNEHYLLNNIKQKTPSSILQLLLEDALMEAIKTGKSADNAIKTIIQESKSEEFDCIVFGCTDINSDTIQKELINIPFYDSLIALVEDCYSYLSESLVS